MVTFHNYLGAVLCVIVNLFLEFALYYILSVLIVLLKVLKVTSFQ